MKGENIIMSKRNNIITKYGILYQACCIYPMIKLTPHGRPTTESLTPEKTVKKFAPEGFVEKFCLNPEQRAKVIKFRK